MSYSSYTTPALSTSDAGYQSQVNKEFIALITIATLIPEMGRGGLGWSKSTNSICLIKEPSKMESHAGVHRPVLRRLTAL